MSVHSTSQTPNSVVLWDKIIQTPQKAKLDISGARNKYAFKEVSASFACVPPAQPSPGISS